MRQLKVTKLELIACIACFFCQEAIKLEEEEVKKRKESPQEGKLEWTNQELRNSAKIRTFDIL